MFPLKINSDFRQLYDVFFDKEGLEFRRMTKEGPNRFEALQFMQQIGLKTPLYGHYADFEKQGYQQQVVVHKSIYTHNGDKKYLKWFSELDEEEKRCLLVQFIPYPINTGVSEVKGHSTRYLFIGHRCFKMDYISYDDWRSNCGDGDIINLCEIYPYPKYRDLVYYPLFAIDFVGDMYAIDFNTAPGVPSEVTKMVCNSEIVHEIKRWYARLCCGMCKKVWRC